MEQTDRCLRGVERGNWMKEGEGISQGSYICNPWTQTTVMDREKGCVCVEAR